MISTETVTRLPVTTLHPIYPRPHTNRFSTISFPKTSIYVARFFSLSKAFVSFNYYSIRLECQCPINFEKDHFSAVPMEKIFKFENLCHVIIRLSCDAQMRRLHKSFETIHVWPFAWWREKSNATPDIDHVDCGYGRGKKYKNGNTTEFNVLHLILVFCFVCIAKLNSIGMRNAQQLHSLDFDNGHSFSRPFFFFSSSYARHSLGNIISIICKFENIGMTIWTVGRSSELASFLLLLIHLIFDCRRRNGLAEWKWPLTIYK